MADDDRKISDEGYKKSDRRVAADGEAETPAAEAPSPSEPAQNAQDAASAEREASATQEAPTETEAPEETPEAPPQAETGEAPDIGVFGILRFAVSLLSQQAWVELGLQALPGHDTRTDLPAARVAIDTLTFLVDKLQPDLDQGEKKELEGLLANLRANYVQRA